MEQHVSDEQKKQRDRDRERMKRRVRQKREALTKRPALVLDMESITVFGATRCMHDVCCVAQTNPDTFAAGETS